MDGKADAKSQWKAIAVVTLVSVGTMIGTSQFLAFYKKKKFVNEVMSLVEKEKIFGTIFEVYPESKERVRVEIAKIHEMNVDVSTKAQDFSRNIIQEYLDKSVPTASDGSIADLLSWNAMLIGRLQNDPVACVDYYLGRKTPDIMVEGNNYSVARREGELKAAVIASSKHSPGESLDYSSMDEAITVLAARYVNARQDVATAAKLEKVGELPPDEGCKVARAFSAALAEGPVAETARLFRHLTRASKAMQPALGGGATGQ